MLDFTELSDDGQDFELLIRELLFTKGYRVLWSGAGPDGGRDLLCYENRDSLFAGDTRKWLVQCKHFARSGRSVGVGDLDNIVDSCNHHDADGYLLVCSTWPSSSLVNRLEAITASPRHDIIATYWDGVQVERLLSTPDTWRIAQRFFPVSAGSLGWQIYATDTPNKWVCNYRGYYIHLTRRVESQPPPLFSIARKIDEIEAIDLPSGHLFRPRAVFFDDAHGATFVWYIDYLYPRGEAPAIRVAEVKYLLGDGYALDDGIVYLFDILPHKYSVMDDHYDKDHYNYYRPYEGYFEIGATREPIQPRLEFVETDSFFYESLEEENEARRNVSFTALKDAISNVAGITVIRAVNSNIEEIDRFYRQFNWSDIIAGLDIEPDLFFSARFYLVAERDRALLDLASYFPTGVDAHFRLTRAYIFAPVTGYIDDEAVYELTISVHPALVSNKYDAREYLNRYFDEIAEQVKTYNLRKATD